jgi:macrophage erythroblast attacher
MSRWDELIQQFRQDQFRLNGLPSTSTLDITLQAGLSALKTPVCGLPDHHNPNCPLCSEHIAQLAAALPFSQRSHSCIVCRISGEVMDERNPPMMMPNGMVYSKNALVAMAKENGGRITCPRTNERFLLTECKNVYLI